MITENLNLNELRVFYAVFQSGGMTAAARVLHLTQSGVSQHISNLERDLGVKLFDRINRKLYPTPAGRALFAACKQGFDTLKGTIQNIKGGEDALVGTLRLGMPQEFGASLISPLLAEFALAHPQLNFELHFEYSQAVLQELVRGELDLAFVDEFARHPAVSTEAVYREILDLCISTELMKKYGQAKHVREYYEKLDYIDYEVAHPLCQKWFQHHLGSDKLRLNMRALVPSTQGVATLISSNMGAGILPRHVSWRLHKETGIHVYQPHAEALSNTIVIAQLQGRTNSIAANRLAEWLKSRLLAASAPQ